MTVRAYRGMVLYTMVAAASLVWCCGAAEADRASGTTASGEVAAQPGHPAEAASAVGSDGKRAVDESKTLTQFINEPATTGNGNTLEGLGVWTVVKMLFWVVVVTLLIYGAAKLLKRYVPGARSMFGAATLKIVGRTYLSPKQSIILVKVGKRMVVVGVSPTEMRALAEISDPDEMDSINSEISGSGRSGTTREFQQDLKDASKEFESSRTTLESNSAQDAGQPGAVDGIRRELDSISRKINLWRKTSD